MNLYSTNHPKVRGGFSPLGELCPAGDASCAMTGPYVNPIDPALQMDSSSGPFANVSPYVLIGLAGMGLFLLMNAKR